MTKLQQIKKKIVEAVPDIIQEFEEQEQTTERLGDFIRQSSQPTGRKNVYERPISLEDVFRALVVCREVGKPYYSFRTIAGSQVYSFQILNEDDKNYLKEFDWELSKPLSEQKPDVIDFLFDILIK